MLFSVFQEWTRSRNQDEWCKDHLVHPRAMRTAKSVRHQLSEIVDVVKKSTTKTAEVAEGATAISKIQQSCKNDINVQN